ICNQLNYLISKAGIQKIKNKLQNINIKNEHDFFNMFDLNFIIKNNLIKTIKYENNNKQMNLEGYVFYSNLDSYGGDIKHYPNKTITELKEIADADENCLGFNTLGFIKNKICNESNMIYL